MRLENHLIGTTSATGWTPGAGRTAAEPPLKCPIYFIADIGHNCSGPLAGAPLWMAASTLSAFTALWGAPALPVHVAPADGLLDAAWAQMPSWAVVPFESLDPRWKVLTVDGQSPIHKDFD